MPQALTKRLNVPVEETWHPLHVPTTEYNEMVLVAFAKSMEDVEFVEFKAGDSFAGAIVACNRRPDDAVCLTVKRLTSITFRKNISHLFKKIK